MLQGGFGTGGAEKIMAAIAAHRHAQGDEVQVAGMFMPPAGPFFPYPRGVRLNVLAGTRRATGCCNCGGWPRSGG